MTEPTAEQPQVTATVSPAAPRSRWGGIPRHLGRARTSTLVLSLLFLAIGALWINIRPDEAAPAATTGVEQPVAPTVPLVPIPQAPTSEPEPAPTTAPAPTTTSEAPTTSAPEATTTGTGTRFPTTSEPPPPPPATTSTPTG